MNIVILDGHTLNPGDLSWDGIQTLGQLTHYAHTPVSEIVSRAKHADAIITNKAPLREADLANLPNLKYIGVTATGYNIVDIEEATRRGITVTNVPGYGTASVAQTTFALLLELCQQVKLHSDAVRAGEWSKNEHFSFWKTPLIELQGRTMGIIGLGQTGLEVARIAHAFGMRVIAAVRSPRRLPEEYAFITLAEQDELFASADVISLHCPQTPETAGIINAQTLAAMKRSAFLINTARGGLIVEQDLADALNNGQIAGAGLDVLTSEPPPADNPLLTACNCLITPHFAWATIEARKRLMEITVRNLYNFMQGTPTNVVY